MPTTELTLPGRVTQGARRRHWLGRTLLAVVLVVVGVAGYRGLHGVVSSFGAPTCRAVALGKEVSFTPEQIANAATITAAAVRRGLPARAATIALATAIQESKLHNVRYGDRDSLGLFQQRPSQGWGTRAQILDPVHASNSFYSALVKIKGYESMDITAVAQKVQRSAYAAAYADHEQEGRILASTLAGHSPGGLGCRLREAASGGDSPADLAAHLSRELPVTTGTSGHTVTVSAPSEQLAWAAGAWAVAYADSHGVTAVTVGKRRWMRSRDQSSWSWQRAPTSLPVTRVTIQLV